jgi:hypothetical protein
MKTYGGLNVQIHIFLTLALAGCEWSASRPGHFTPGERAPRYLLDRRLDGPQSRYGCGEKKILDPTGTRTPTSSVTQSVACGYTDYATPAPVINTILNEEELPDEGKESVIVPTYKECDKTDDSNYRGISLLPTIFLSRLSPHTDEITGEYQCGFRRNSSTTDQIFCIRRIWGKNGSIMRQHIS